MNLRSSLNSLIITLKAKLFWDNYYNKLRDPKVSSPVPYNSVHDELFNMLKNRGINLVELEIDIGDYKKFLNNSMDIYKKYNYYNINFKKDPVFIEKSLEHYLAAKLLKLSNQDIYIDIASLHSPVSEIYGQLYGCETYQQDLVYPEGIHGKVIGGDASDMPLPDSFCTKMGLHCSFEHFEQDSDINFIKEVNRVLNVGGKTIILPLYLFLDYAIQTDPVVLPKEGVEFDENATLYAAKGWKNRHARFYDVENFITRIINNLNELKLTIFYLKNEKEVDSSVYIKFICLLEKV